MLLNDFKYPHMGFYVLKMGQLRSIFLFIFGLFKQTINTIFTTNQYEKCIQYRDSTPQPHEHEPSTKPLDQGSR